MRVKSRGQILESAAGNSRTALQKNPQGRGTTILARMSQPKKINATHGADARVTLTRKKREIESSDLIKECAGKSRGNGSGRRTPAQNGAGHVVKRGAKWVSASGHDRRPDRAGSDRSIHTVPGPNGPGGEPEFGISRRRRMTTSPSRIIRPGRSASCRSSPICARSTGRIRRIRRPSSATSLLQLVGRTYYFDRENFNGTRSRPGPPAGGSRSDPA